MTNVITLNTREEIKPTIDKNLIDTILAVLHHAEAGMVKTVAIAWVDPDGNLDSDHHFCGTTDDYILPTAVSRLHAKLIQECAGE